MPQRVPGCDREQDFLAKLHTNRIEYLRHNHVVSRRTRDGRDLGAQIIFHLPGGEWMN